MGVPLDASVQETYTPDALLNLPDPPVFTLRVASKRDWINFQDGLIDYPGLDRPLVMHGIDELRTELLRGLETAWTSDSVAADKSRIQQTWAMIDQKLDVPDADLQHAADLDELVTREWTPLRKMQADNMRWQRDAARIAVGMFVVGWTGIDFAFRRTAGVISLTDVDELARAIFRLEEKYFDKNGNTGRMTPKADAPAGMGTPGTAFLQLSNRAMGQLNLSETERKNSESPSPPSGIQPDMTMKPSEPTAEEASQASATSGPKKTPSAKSRQKTGT